MQAKGQRSVCGQGETRDLFASLCVLCRVGRASDGEGALEEGGRVCCHRHVEETAPRFRVFAQIEREKYPCTLSPQYELSWIKLVDKKKHGTIGSTNPRSHGLPVIPGRYCRATEIVPTIPVPTSSPCYRSSAKNNDTVPKAKHPGNISFHLSSSSLLHPRREIRFNCYRTCQPSASMTARRWEDDEPSTIGTEQGEGRGCTCSSTPARGRALSSSFSAVPVAWFLSFKHCAVWRHVGYFGGSQLYRHERHAICQQGKSPQKTGFP